MKRLRTTILFSVPALIFGGILLYFIFWNFRNSLMDYSLIHSHPVYVGLQTYQLVFSDPSFTSSLLRSLIWSHSFSFFHHYHNSGNYYYYRNNHCDNGSLTHSLCRKNMNEPIRMPMAFPPPTSAPLQNNEHKKLI